MGFASKESCVSLFIDFVPSKPVQYSVRRVITGLWNHPKASSSTAVDMALPMSLHLSPPFSSLLLLLLFKSARERERERETVYFQALIVLGGANVCCGLSRGTFRWPIDLARSDWCSWTPQHTQTHTQTALLFLSLPLPISLCLSVLSLLSQWFGLARGEYNGSQCLERLKARAALFKCPEISFQGDGFQLPWEHSAWL